MDYMQDGQRQFEKDMDYMQDGQRQFENDMDYRIGKDSLPA